MNRIKEEFLEKIESVVSLTGLAILETGCGQGQRTIFLANRAKTVTAIDPDQSLITTAQRDDARPNITYRVAKAESLPFGDRLFDASIFTLSFHHVPVEKMSRALSEAARVTKRGGWIVILEPGTKGSFFEAELLFDACDGDERAAKLAAKKTMSGNAGLLAVKELTDETIFQFDSLEDFIANMKPLKNLKQLEQFLQDHRFTLNAERRINIFQVQ